MGLFRSEDMHLYKVFIMKDNARAILNAFGM